MISIDNNKWQVLEIRETPQPQIRSKCQVESRGINMQVGSVKGTTNPKHLWILV